MNQSTSRITRRISLVLVAATLWVLSCEEDSPVETNLDSGVALPLEEGNVWEYQRLTFDENGFLTDSSTLVMSVAARDTFGTEVGYRLDNFLFFTIVHPPVAVRWTNKSDGVYDIHGDPLAPSSPPDVHRALPFPTFPGDSLVYAGLSISTYSINEPITITSGSYECVRYDVFSGGSLVGQIFIAANLGIVRAWQQQFGNSRVVDELRSFEIGN